MRACLFVHAHVTDPFDRPCPSEKKMCCRVCLVGAACIYKMSCLSCVSFVFTILLPLYRCFCVVFMMRENRKSAPKRDLLTFIGDGEYTWWCRTASRLSSSITQQYNGKEPRQRQAFSLILFCDLAVVDNCCSYCCVAVCVRGRLRALVIILKIFT